MTLVEAEEPEGCNQWLAPSRKFEGLSALNQWKPITCYGHDIDSEDQRIGIQPCIQTFQFSFAPQDKLKSSHSKSSRNCCLMEIGYPKKKKLEKEKKRRNEHKEKELQKTE